MTKPFVFILMPFKEEFNDIYELGIKPACIDAGAYCERVDEQVYEGDVINRIFNQISKADFIICDMSGENPNVFFEAGYAKALDKKMIFLTSSDPNDMPFDLRNYPHIIYTKGIAYLKRKLNNHLDFYLKNPELKAKDIKFGINAYIVGEVLSEAKENRIIITDKNIQIVTLSIENITGSTILPNNMQITIYGSKQEFFIRHMDKRIITNQNNEIGFSINDSVPHFNDSIETYSLAYIHDSHPIDMTLHIYHNNIKRSYSATITKNSDNSLSIAEKKAEECYRDIDIP